MIRRRKPLRRKTWMRRRSKRMTIRTAEYEAIKKDWMPLHPTCEVGPIIAAAGFKVRCHRVTKHPHHTKGRLGTNLCDTSTWLASCDGECHPQWVHFTHVKEARKLGLIP